MVTTQKDVTRVPKSQRAGGFFDSVVLQTRLEPPDAAPPTGPATPAAVPALGGIPDQ